VLQDGTEPTALEYERKRGAVMKQWRLPAGRQVATMWFCNIRLQSGAGKKTEVKESHRLEPFKPGKNEK